MNVSPSQWRAVGAVQDHVLVTAGAGTGKTRTVVGRMLYLLGVPVNGQRAERTVSLRELAAITFTNAAAADLKAKLREALRTAGRHQDAYLVDTARVGTIHAFCGDVLREFALRSGGNPREEVLDESEAVGLRAQAVRDAVAHALERNAIGALDELLRGWSLRQVERFVLTLLHDLDRLRSLRDARDDHGPRERALIELADGAAEVMERRLRERGQIDFDRMILRTRDLLRRDAAAREALRRRLAVLIVDEFQDVDPVQREIAYLIGDPASERYDTPRLMLVGDPKQSIYRFRRADVTVWRSVERDFRERGHGVVVALEENYRSTAPILGFVDATVGAILEQPADGVAHRDDEVRFQAVGVAGDTRRRGPPVELLVVPAREDGRDYAADEVRRIEAAAVARRARGLVDAGEVGWGDMAVMIPTWTTAALHKAALEAEGATAFPLRMAGFYDRREIVDLILALEAIRDPWDDRALVGFLRGPFVGLKDETLLDMARQAQPPYWDALSDVAVGEPERLDRAVRLLRRHVALRDRVPADELLESLFTETGYLAHLRLLGEERLQALADVDKFLRLARTASRQTLGEFLRTIEEIRSRPGEEGEVPLVQPRDAVTITTVHSAKGLEWKVVFWCDLVQWIRRGDGQDVLVGRHTLALKDADVKADDAPAAWQSVRDERAREDYAERKRVWYVAATRASDRLVVSGLPAGAMRRASSNTVADHLWGALGEVPLEEGAEFTYRAADGTPHVGVVRLADPSVLSAAPAAPPHERPVAPIEEVSTTLPPVAVSSGRPRHSATELLAFARCQRKHWFEYVLGVREPQSGAAPSEITDAATRGRIVHDVLEHLRKHDELDRLLEDAIRRCDPEAPVPEQPEGRRYRDALRQEIRSVADHPDYRAIADHPTARRELGFVHVTGPDAFYEGGIDLAAAERDGLALLDVKTSHCTPEDANAKAAQFAPQRDVYVAAAEAITGRQVARFAFQFSRSRVHVSQAVTERERREIAARLTAALDAMGQGTPKLTDNPAECRFCGFKRVGWCEGVEARSAANDGDVDEQLELL
jgi:ATP-dependent helicase/nuclease subunit A